MKVVAVFDIPDGMKVKENEQARLVVTNSRGDGIVHGDVFCVDSKTLATLERYARKLHLFKNIRKKNQECNCEE